MRTFLLLLLVFCFCCLITGGFLLLWGYNYITRDLPRLNNISDYKPPAVSKLYAGDGTLLAEEYSERRYPVKLADVPVYVRNAFLASEDASFYAHPGIDPISIVRAFIKNIRQGSVRQGGSTITQQVVKNLVLTGERKIERKIKEAILAYRIEQRLSKDEILEIYLNQIFLGNKAYGIRSAANLYFHKEVKDLTLGEAAILAGLPQAPSRYSPVTNLPQAKKRQKYVLEQMVQASFINEAAAKAAAEEELKVFWASSSSVYRAPYFVADVLKLFEKRWKDLNVKTDGL